MTDNQQLQRFAQSIGTLLDVALGDKVEDETSYTMLLAIKENCEAVECGA